MAKRKIVDARADSDGDITDVKFAGNKRWTNKDRAIEMARRDEIEDVHVSRTGEGREYLRTNPDNRKKNNLDHMAGDD